MKLINKYHEHGMAKKRLQSLKQLNQELALDYNLKEYRDLLKLSVIETALKNKKQFEDTFERVRNENFDAWDYWQFQERNLILQRELESVKPSLKHFIDRSGNRIYIPCFNDLLNTLYDQETAVLELPQFFKLYTSFKQDLIDVETYGLLPYKANMSEAEYLAGNEDTIVLYQESLHQFIVLTETDYEYIAVIGDTSIDPVLKIRLAEHLLQQQELEFIRILVDHELLKPRCIKKLRKKYKKEQGIDL